MIAVLSTVRDFDGRTKVFENYFTHNEKSLALHIAAAIKEKGYPLQKGGFLTVQRVSIIDQDRRVALDVKGRVKSRPHKLKQLNLDKFLAREGENNASGHQAVLSG